MIKNIKKIEIGTKDQIVIKDNNVFQNSDINNFIYKIKHNLFKKGM